MRQWREVFLRIGKSDFCRGVGGRGWVASFDWAVVNAGKVIEGTYENRTALASEKRRTGRTREIVRADLERQKAVLDARETMCALDPRTVRAELRARLDDWRGLLRRHVPQARQILKKLFPQPLLLGPDCGGYALRGNASIEKILRGTPYANMVTSPAGFVPAGGMHRIPPRA